MAPSANRSGKLDALGISFEIVPGVPAYAAAAALLKRELTLPNVTQTVILTRTAMKASEMPNAEDLDTLGKSGATLAIHLSVRNMKHVCETLIPTTARIARSRSFSAPAGRTSR